MNESVFIETTIPSYYVARRSRDIVQAARQETTIEWWDNHRVNYRLFTSIIVVTEAKLGDERLREKRSALLDETTLLPMTPQVKKIASEILAADIVPEKASDDALHIACAGVYEMEFLLTWNCAHIANPHNFRRIAKCLSKHNLRMPVICTPEEFLGNDYENHIT